MYIFEISIAAILKIIPNYFYYRAVLYTNLKKKIRQNSIHTAEEYVPLFHARHMTPML